jgi:hypothetical protein
MDTNFNAWRVGDGGEEKDNPIYKLSYGTIMGYGS